VRDRQQRLLWAERTGVDGIRAYRDETNRFSIDGLPGLDDSRG
jgi:hypothetical protein